MLAGELDKLIVAMGFLLREVGCPAVLDIEEGLAGLKVLESPIAVACGLWVLMEADHWISGNRKGPWGIPQRPSLCPVTGGLSTGLPREEVQHLLSHLLVGVLLDGLGHLSGV